MRRFLQSIPGRVKRGIRTVCTDMYEGFINAVKEVLVRARVVVECYHVAKLYREDADQLRKQESRPDMIRDPGCHCWRHRRPAAFRSLASGKFWEGHYH